jgi:hypothetical protein
MRATCFKFLLTQGAKTATICLHRTPSTDYGFWKSPKPADFRDTGHGDQFVWDRQIKWLLAFNDIGQTNTQKKGHPVGFGTGDGSTAAAFTLFQVPVITQASLKGTKGEGVVNFIHSHTFSQGPLSWEYQGTDFQDFQITADE